MATDDSQPVAEQLDQLVELLLVHGQGPLLGGRLAGGLSRRVAGGIPPAQLQALAVLAGGDMRMRELARRLGLATSTVTRLVDRLEAAGLAERRSERPDRRSILVGLSRAGHEAIRAVRRRVHTLLAEAIAGLTPREQGQVLRLLTKLGEALVLRPPQPALVPVRVRNR
jgi:DNA-binding MarR family transcriptional regulator